MPIDIYSTRAQLQAIEQMPREYSALHDYFCHDSGTVEDSKAIWDYRKGSRRMAPTVHPGTGGVLMERDGYQTREIGFCCIAPERIIAASSGPSMSSWPSSARAKPRRIWLSMTPELPRAPFSAPRAAALDTSATLV